MPLDSIIILRSSAVTDPKSLRSRELKASKALNPGIEFNLYLSYSAAFSTLIWVLHIFWNSAAVCGKNTSSLLKALGT
jgi:hypothetical protein